MSAGGAASAAATDRSVRGPGSWPVLSPRGSTTMVALGPHLLVSGFGPFFEVDENPSRDVAFALESEPPPGVRVSAVELPVTIESAGDVLAAAVAGAEPVDAVLSLGVQKEPFFRVERRARCRLSATKPDNDGFVPAGTVLSPARDLATALDVAACVRALLRSGAHDARPSDDAGGFVCERVYHRALALGAERGLPALFLHLPPAHVRSAREQVPHVRALVEEVARQVARVRRSRQA